MALCNGQHLPGMSRHVAFGYFCCEGFSVSMVISCASKSQRVRTIRAFEEGVVDRREHLDVFGGKCPVRYSGVSRIPRKRQPRSHAEIDEF